MILEPLLQDLLQAHFHLNRDYWLSLPPTSHQMIEAALWVFAVGVVFITAILAYHAVQLLLIALLRQRLAKIAWERIGTQERLIQLRRATFLVPSLNWGVRKIQRLIEQSSTTMVDDVADLAVMRHRETGFLQLFPRIEILLGLVGTLLGLSMAAQSVIEVTHTQEIVSVMSAIKGALGGLKFAFVTTIIGVLTAVLLSPLVVAGRWSQLRLIHALYDALTTEIIPLFRPQHDDPLRDLPLMVEEVTSRVVQSIVTETVTGSAASMSELAQTLLVALNATRTERCDIVAVVDSLDQATAGIRKVNTAAAEAIGGLNQHMQQLVETVGRLTPERQLHDKLVQEIGRVLHEELSRHWTDLRHQNERQIETVENLGAILAALEGALGGLGQTVRAETEPVRQLGIAFRQQQDTHNELIQNLVQMFGQIGTALAELREGMLAGIEPFQDMSDKNMQQMVQIQEAVRYLTENADGITKLLTAIEHQASEQPGWTLKALDTVTSSLGALVGHVESLSNHTDGKIEKLLGEILGENAELTRILKDMKEQRAESGYVASAPVAPAEPLPSMVEPLFREPDHVGREIYHAAVPSRGSEDARPESALLQASAERDSVSASAPGADPAVVELLTYQARLSKRYYEHVMKQLTAIISLLQRNAPPTTGLGQRQAPRGEWRSEQPSTVSSYPPAGTPRTEVAMPPRTSTAATPSAKSRSWFGKTVSRLRGRD